MFLTILFILLSLISVGTLFICCEWYTQWYMYFVGAILLPVSYILCVLICIIIVAIISLFLSKEKDVTKPNKAANFMVKEVCHQINLFSRVKIKINGSEKLPKEKCLFVSNHLSMYDPIVVVDKLKKQPIMCITKIENEKIPVAGPFIHTAGYVPLDRSSAKSAIAVIRKGANYIANDLANVYIFPEGTRSKTNELLPFHAGSFKIATKANCPIVVMNLNGTNLVHKNFPLKRTKVTVDILDVLYPEYYNTLNTNDLAEKTRQMIDEFQKNMK